MTSKIEDDFIYFHVPRDDPQALAIAAQKYRELRLTGLRLSPEVFSAKLATESLLPESAWVSRLQQEGVQTFICAVPAPSDNVDTPDGSQTKSDESKWIAHVTLRGPVSVEDYDLPEESGQPRLAPDADKTEERWVLNALYMMPEYRGRGISQRLCAEAALWLETARLRAPSSQLQAIRIRAMIAPDNKASHSLFLKMGYVDGGLCTKAEAMCVNRDGSPANPDDPEYCTRVGLIVVYTIKR